MYAKVFFVLAAAVLLGAIYAGGEALARGGGGGGGGRGGHGGMMSGMMSGWRGFAGNGMHHTSSHSTQFPFKGQHANGMHNLGRNQHHDHGHMLAQGQWHRMPGFGGQGQKGSNMPGVWHKVASFGGHGEFNGKHDFRRDWQAGGGGWGYVGVGDLCLSPGSCQGIWQAVPQSGSQPRQSRSLQRNWQVNGEL